MVKFIENNYKYYVLCVDLNSKSTSFGCNNKNKKGELLSIFLEGSSLILVNNEDITLFTGCIMVIKNL